MRDGFGSTIVVAVAISAAAFATSTLSGNPSNPVSQPRKGTNAEIVDSQPAKAGSGDSETSGRITEEAKKEASEIFKERCVTCHGEQGRGDGPGASNLMPKPIDFHNSNWQVTVSDADIAKAIVQGGPAVGLSNQMQSNPDLEDKPGVVAALVERIRKWKK